MRTTSEPLPRSPRGVARLLELWRLFRAERDDPAPFYQRLANDVVADLAQRHGRLFEQRVVDLGSGPGFYTRAFREVGAEVLPLESEIAELQLAGDPPAGAVIGDAARLPIRSRTVDGVFCSNMLEHARDPARVIDEMARVLRQGGWGYLSFTNWYSPWGGHEMSPYHLLGPRLGVRLYERRHGSEHKHRVGQNLFPTHIGPVLRLFAARDDVQVDSVEPRYWPWASFITRVPGVRELLSWNCVVRFTRRR